MPVITVDSGQSGRSIDVQYGQGVNSGTFVLGAASTTVVTDANVTATTFVSAFPTNGPAGLLLRSKSCYIATGSSGSFTFTVSASGAGAPAGTETFAYVVQRSS